MHLTRFALFLAYLTFFPCWALAGELSIHQKLILACHQLDVPEVVLALRAGANPNSRFGNGDPLVFQDKWDTGWPVSARSWTPLIAAASASPYPPPPRPVKNIFEDMEWVQAQQRRIPQMALQKRRRARSMILNILLSHDADINADDGYGATALYIAIEAHHVDFATTLLSFKPKVNTHTRTYIDDPGGMTPLHVATYSREHHSPAVGSRCRCNCQRRIGQDASGLCTPKGPSIA